MQEAPIPYSDDSHTVAWAQLAATRPELPRASPAPAPSVGESGKASARRAHDRQPPPSPRAPGTDSARQRSHRCAAMTAVARHARRLARHPRAGSDSHWIRDATRCAAKSPDRFQPGTGRSRRSTHQRRTAEQTNLAASSWRRSHPAQDVGRCPGFANLATPNRARRPTERRGHQLPRSPELTRPSREAAERSLP
jgi:hypothetical protein